MPLTTFADCVNEVLNYGFNDGPQVNRNRVKNWINEAEFQIAREVEGPEFQLNASVTLVVGQYTYALPVTFARAQDLSYPNGNSRLRPVDIQEFDSLGVFNANGIPTTYTTDQTNLLVFPNPTITDALLLRYIGVPTTMVNDSDVPTLNPNYLHLLVEYALFRAFDAEDDYEAKQNFLTQYKADLAAYATDVQFRDVDRPRQLGGTWSSTTGFNW